MVRVTSLRRDGGFYIPLHRRSQNSIFPQTSVSVKMQFCLLCRSAGFRRICDVYIHTIRLPCGRKSCQPRRRKLHIARFRAKRESSFIPLLLLSPRNLRLRGDPKRQPPFPPTAVQRYNTLDFPDGKSCANRGFAPPLETPRRGACRPSGHPAIFLAFRPNSAKTAKLTKPRKCKNGQGS